MAHTHTHTLIALQQIGAQKSQVVVLKKMSRSKRFFHQKISQQISPCLRTFFLFLPTLGADEAHHCPRSTFQQVGPKMFTENRMFWRSHQLLYMKPYENWDILHTNWSEESLKHQEQDFVTSIKPMSSIVCVFQRRIRIVRGRIRSPY